MVDVREDILARLLEVVATIPNVRATYRNNINIDETEVPAAVVLDGDEETNDGSDLSARPSNKPIIVRMTPGLLILDQGDLAGSQLSIMRREMIKLVLNDTELNQIAKTGRLGNGAIRYLGCQSDMGWARNLRGALAAQFLFKYGMYPHDL